MGYEINRTELVWPGKYDEQGKRVAPPRVSLPFQVIERVNESRATRESKKAKALTLFDAYEGDKGETFEDGWRNKLIWGDNALVMSSLLSQFAGKADLIYIDPPFATGANFSFKAEVGEEGVEVVKEQSPLEERAYRDTWGKGIQSYLSMMAERLELMRDLLSDHGILLTHIDWRVSHHLRGILDDLFGVDAFRNEIVWSYRTGGAPRGGSWPRKHDTILVYVKRSDERISTLKERQYLEKPFMGSKVDDAGRNYVDTIVRDVLEGELLVVRDGGQLEPFNVRPVLNVSSERLGYDTQKPLGLLKLLIEAMSRPGDLVCDFFVGSGTTLEAAEVLGRRWIGCDLGRFAVHVSRKRMLEVPLCQPFELLNLGQYERQYWHAATFGEDEDGDGSVSLLEYIAFILKLYGARPVTGSTSLHGQRAKAYVHVGSVESPVTMQEVADAIEECLAFNGSELHVLGWEWEMGLNDTMTEQAKGAGVRLVLRQIPREVMEAQAAANGDITFHELAYLVAEVKPSRGKREYVATLEDFLIPNPDLIPDEVRKKIKKWSDFVDYWAVDWNFSDDTFMQGWVTYRTRKDRTLAFRSDPHSYGEPGEYSVMVKVIDIFGNDTSKIIRVKVK